MTGMTDWELFEYCHDRVIFWEKPIFTNNKNDLGGATNHGVTQKALEAYLGHKVTVKEVKELSPELAKKIYYIDFWRANGCHLLPPAIALLLFDGCVNQSASAIKKYLQMAVGVKADGAIGPATAASTGKQDVVEVTYKFMALRCLRYAGSATFKHHGLGWFRRVIDMTLHSRDLMSTQKKGN